MRTLLVAGKSTASRRHCYRIVAVATGTATAAGRSSDTVTTVASTIGCRNLGCSSARAGCNSSTTASLCSLGRNSVAGQRTLNCCHNTAAVLDTCWLWQPAASWHP